MSGIETVRAAIADVGAAADAGEWDRADRALQYLAGAWRRAGLRGDEAAEAARLLAELRIRFVTEHDVAQVVGPEQLAWMLAGFCNVAGHAS